jgi:hypothetical protein
MMPRSFPSFVNRALNFFSIASILTIFSVVPVVTAQTTQPFLFASTYDNTSNSAGFVTLLRNGTTGVLTMPSNTAVSFKDPCVPTTIDPTGSFLFGTCGEGVAMYTLDPTTGIVAETPTSPYSASLSTGETGVLVVAESTGQYLYLLKVLPTQSPVASTFILDTFQIDPTTPSLIPVNSQSLSFDGTWIGSVADPSRHGMFVYVNQEQSGSPVALLFPIAFDLSTGLATIPTSGMTLGQNGRSIAISPSGGYVALGWGSTTGSLTVYQLSTTDFSLAPVNTVNLGAEDNQYGNYTFPDTLFFSSGGNLLYVQAPPANFTGGACLPFLVFDPTTATQLSTPPISVSDATFLNGIVDPQAPFTYVGDSGPATYGISVYEIDLSTGLPSQPAPISSPFFPQTDMSPLFVTIEQGGQGIQAATLGSSPGALSFAPTVTGQSSTSQTIVLKSLGAQSVSLTSIEISGANSVDFSETDNCMSSPVLPTNHTCSIAVTYGPSTVGTSQATLFITDNAAGSPQSIALSGAAIAPPPVAPAVTLNPGTTLAFPGTPTQGTSTGPQTVTLTNSGGAALQMLSTVLSGFNSSDFSISADTCSASIAPNASCAISIIFSPLAAGVRNTTLTITDNASNSPQSIAVSGTAVASATIVAAEGASTATISPGQTAKFILQVTPAAGFNGTLSFGCSGAPFGATCTVPANLTVSNGNPVSLTVSISTLGAAQAVPDTHIVTRRPGTQMPLYFVALLLATYVSILLLKIAQEQNRLLDIANTVAAFGFSLALIFSGIGCAAGVATGGASPKTSSISTVATPTIQPSGGTFTAAQSVSIVDSTNNATIYYTTDGSTPTSASPLYTGAFSLTSITTVQAIASASGYNNSTVASCVFKFQTPAATYPISINVTATAAGSSKALQLNPIVLTLIVS